MDPVLLLLTALILTAAVASGRVLLKRHRWEQQHRRIAICADYDDTAAAAIRAGLPMDEMLRLLVESGATHVSLPEMTLNRLLRTGHLSSCAPEPARHTEPSVGHWTCLSGAPELVTRLVEELRVRVPQTEASSESVGRLVFAGDLTTIGEIGLGFDDSMAERIRANRLGIVPRPVSYDWPEGPLLERTLKQAATIGRIVAFEGDMILGHEMHLEETLEAMARYGLLFAYFCESRHQKGDWFIAKRRVPGVALAHRFSPAEMSQMDSHAAVYNWLHLARERGVRFCYVNFFRVLHAVEPLEGLHYIRSLARSLESADFVLDGQAVPPLPVPGPGTGELAVAGVGAAAIGAAVVSLLLQLPGIQSALLCAAAAAGAAALPYLERAWHSRLAAGHRHHHDHEHKHSHGHGHDDLSVLYPSRYAPKLIALAVAVMGPLAVALISTGGGTAGWLAGVLIQLAAMALLALVTSGQEFSLRIEEFRGFNLDWLIPLGVIAFGIPLANVRIAVLAALGAAWLLAQRRQIDVLALADPGHAMGHTHHISKAQAFLGDLGMAVGPKPARKWTGLAPLAYALSLVLASHGQPGWAASAALAGVGGSVLGMVGFRRPERRLAITARQSGLSLLLGATAGGLVLLGAQLWR